MGLLTSIRAAVFGASVAAVDTRPIPGFVPPGAAERHARSTRSADRFLDSPFDTEGSGTFEAASTTANVPLLTNPSPSTLVNGNRRFRAWSRWLYVNDTWFRGMVDRMCERVVGRGPTLNSRSAGLKRLWPQVAKHIDSRGCKNFGKWVRNSIYRPYVMDGEVFLRLIPLPHTGFDKDGFPTFGDDASPISFEVRACTADFVPEYMYEATQGSFWGQQTFTHYGVILKRDNLDKRAGYWVYDYHPYDVPPTGKNDWLARPVPADQVFHLFDPPTPGAVRGENRWTPMFLRAHRLHDYEVAEVRRKQLNNALSVIATRDPSKGSEPFLPGEVDEFGDPLAGGDGPDDGDDAPNRPVSWGQMPLTSGGIVSFPDGYQVTVNDPKATPQTDDWWSRFQIIAMCACAGLPDYEVTQDYSNVQSDRVLKMATQNSKAKHGVERGTCDEALHFINNAIVRDLAMTGRFVPPDGETFEDYYDEPMDWPIIETAQTNQDIAAFLDAIDKKVVNRDYVTKQVIGLDPENNAKLVAEIAARDYALGFNDPPVATLKDNGSAIPPWEPKQPAAAKLLQQVQGDLFG